MSTLSFTSGSTGVPKVKWVLCSLIDLTPIPKKQGLSRPCDQPDAFLSLDGRGVWFERARPLLDGLWHCSRSDSTRHLHAHLFRRLAARPLCQRHCRAGSSCKVVSIAARDCDCAHSRHGPAADCRRLGRHLEPHSRLLCGRRARQARRDSAAAARAQLFCHQHDGKHRDAALSVFPAHSRRFVADQRERNYSRRRRNERRSAARSQQDHESEKPKIFCFLLSRVYRAAASEKLESCTCARTTWPRNISVCRKTRKNDSCPTRSFRKGSAFRPIVCTKPAMWAATCRAASSSAVGAATTKSKSEAFV